MKRIIASAVAILLVAASVNAQNIVNAAHIGSESISGTARYRSMAGAFGALGGDPSVITDNPAGLAIYRGTNVLTITPHWDSQVQNRKAQKKLPIMITTLPCRIWQPSSRTAPPTATTL